jgi:hypothetical protein
MRLTQNCDVNILDWTSELMKSVIEKLGGHLIDLQASMNDFKPAQIEGSFCFWFHSTVLCELGLPPRNSILKSDHQGQRGVMGCCVSTGECWVTSASSYRLILKRGGGSRDGSQTGRPISSDTRVKKVPDRRPISTSTQ